MSRFSRVALLAALAILLLVIEVQALVDIEGCSLVSDRRACLSARDVISPCLWCVPNVRDRSSLGTCHNNQQISDSSTSSKICIQAQDRTLSNLPTKKVATLGTGLGGGGDGDGDGDDPGNVLGSCSEAKRRNACDGFKDFFGDDCKWCTSTKSLPATCVAEPLIPYLRDYVCD